MKVCFFGIYNPEYSRNKILISGLKENGVEVVECRVEPSIGKIKKYTELMKKFSEIRKSNFDFVVVGFSGHSMVWLAYLLFGGRQQIIFDAFVSLYNSNVEDRQKYSPLSWRAFKDWFLDWFGCNLADTILLDTDEQIKYFVKRFGLRKDKFKRVFVGSNDNLFYPFEKKENLNKFVVHFHGSFIPLQGVEYIIKSAKILEKEKEIVFNIIGGGQEYQKMRKLAGDLKLKNLNFIDKVPYNKLVEYINNADVCLGIFGTTPKTNIVIPNKVFEALACGKAIITANTPAIRELLTDKENTIFCKAGDEKDLAEKILFLKKDQNLREKLAQNSRQLFVQKLTPRIIVKELLEELGEIKIAIITPIFKQDYLTDTVLDGLIQLQKEGRKIRFFISSKYKTRLPFKFLRLNRWLFVKFAKKADIVLFLWGKGNTDFSLVEKIDEWQKTIFIDGSELGGNRRLDDKTNKQVLDKNYQGNGRIDTGMLKKCALYLRREKPYIDGIKPFPFGIESSYVGYKQGVKKDIDFTCIFGQEDFPPLRRDVRNELEKYCSENGFNCVTKKTKTAKEFYNILARTKVGISVSGGGYDTARFWEILGNNCILLTEKIELFKEDSKDLEYKTIYEFVGIDGFKNKLKEVGGLIRNSYSEDENFSEFERILKKHSSKARVEFILEEAKNKGII